jgi:hypothetical protein
MGQRAGEAERLSGNLMSEEEEALRSDRAYERGPARREPTIGIPPLHAEAAARQPSRKIPGEGDRGLLSGYEVSLAHDELQVDEIEIVDTNGLNYLVLTDRRLIIRGRDHQTIYPLRAISRLAVVRYIRWGMVLLGVALTALGGIGALMPVLVFVRPPAELIYLWAGLSIAGVLTIVIALLRPIFYVEIKSLGGDLRLRLTKNYEALVGFLDSLGQRIG